MMFNNYLEDITFMRLESQ